MSESYKGLILPVVILLFVLAICWVSVATAVNYFRPNLDQSRLIESGIERGLHEQGLLITEVIPESAAAEANLQRGHIILAADGELTNEPDALRQLVTTVGAGERIRLTVLDGTEIRQLRVMLATTEPYLGVNVVGVSESNTPVEPTVTAEMTSTEIVPIVLTVLPDSPAAVAGFEVNDVITAVNGQSVTDVPDLVELMRQQQLGQEATFTVQRGKQSIILTAQLAPHPDNPEQAFLGLELPPTQ